jgi:hypothetical protein
MRQNFISLLAIFVGKKNERNLILSVNGAEHIQLAAVIMQA